MSQSKAIFGNCLARIVFGAFPFSLHEVKNVAYVLTWASLTAPPKVDESHGDLPRAPLEFRFHDFNATLIATLGNGGTLNPF